MLNFGKMIKGRHYFPLMDRMHIPFLGLFFILLIGCASETDSEKMIIQWWDGPTVIGIPGQERRPDDTAKDYLSQIARQFEAQYPEVKIEISIYGWEEIRNKIKIAMMAGSGPDIGYDSVDVILNYARIGALEPVEDYMTDEDREDFFPGNLKRATFQGHTWCWPLDTSSPCFIAVNRRIFRERGVEHLLPKLEDPEWTFEEFIQAAKAVTFDSDGDGEIDVWGYGMQFKETYGYARNSFLWGMGASIFDESGTRFNLNSPEAEQALQLIYDLEYKYKVMKPGGTALRWYDLQQDWIRSKLVMVPALASLKEGIKDAIRDEIAKPGELEIYPIPFPRAMDRSPRLYLGDDGMCVFKQKDPRKKELVMKLAQFITNTQHQRERSPFINMFPARKSVGNVYPNNPFMQQVDRLRIYGSADASKPLYVAMRPIIATLFQSVMIGERKPKAALEEAEKRALRMLRKEDLL